MPRKKKEMTLVAAAKPQLKKRARRDWSKAKAAKFLGVIGDTCNISEACRQTGMSMTVVYRRRKMDAAFRAEWAETLAGAYRRLELVLLERAFNGVERVVRRRDGSDHVMREYSDQLGLKLLKMHRDTVIEAETEVPAESADEIRERLIRKLQRLRQRNEKQEAERAGLRRDGSRDETAVDRDARGAGRGL